MIDATFIERARAAGGVNTLDGAEFAPFTHAARLVATYGHEVSIPNCFSDRPGVVIPRADCLLLQVASRVGDECAWSRTIRKHHWSLVLPIEAGPIESDCIRAVEFDGVGITEFDGIYIRTKRGCWSRRSESSATRFARFKYGLRKEDAERMIGGLHYHPWHRKCVPFLKEYPGDHVWNRGAPQLAHEPKAGDHPHWNAIFSHAGQALDKYIPDALKAIGIDSGGKYLLAWFAWIIRDPAARLPYLFFFGGENCGKSILWEAFSLLVTGGMVKADRALTSEFNGELDGAILCVVEEKEISRAAGVVDRMKDAVTGLTIAVRRMRTDQFQVINYTHWLQTANSRGACLIPPGDTRMIAIQVDPLTTEIAKPELLSRLTREAPAILHTMLTMTLPKPQGRLALPVISTPEKLVIQGDHVSPLADKIVELLEGQTEWRGTASQLREALGDGPGTIGKMSAAIDRLAPYLATHGITAHYPPDRTAKGKIIILRRGQQ